MPDIEAWSKHLVGDLYEISHVLEYICEKESDEMRNVKL